MSAVCAVLDSVRIPTIERVEQLLSPSLRMPGDIGVAGVFGACALGARPVALTVEDSGVRQPLSRGSIHLVFAGRLDNRKDLAAALGCDEHSASDASLVALAYEAWGPACAEQLVGGFSALVWDAREERLVGVVDHLASCPLFYTQLGDAFVVASTIRQLRSLTTGAGRLDKAYFLARLTLPAVGTLPCSNTPFVGISRLVPGATLVARPGRPVIVSRYWRPENLQELTGGIMDVGARLHEGLERAVQSQCRSSAKVMITLSGGLDSSSIAGLAANLVSQSNLPCQGVVAMALVYGAQPDADEGHYRAAAEQAFGLRAIVTDASSSWHYLCRNDACGWLGDEPANTAAVHNDSALIASTVAQAGCNVVLYGLGGDELTTGSEHMLAEWLRRGEFARLWADARRFAAMGNRTQAFCLWSLAVAPLLASRVRAIGGVQWRERSSRGERSWYQQVVPRWLKGGAREREMLRRVYSEMSTLHVRPVARAEELWRIRMGYPAGPMNDVSYYPMGLEMRAPFYDRRFVELALAVPAHMKIKPVGRRRFTKRVLRAGLRGVLPWPILTRRSKAATDFQQSMGLDREWSRLWNDGQFALADHGLVDADVARETLRAARLGRCEDAVQLRSLLIAELWTRHADGS